MDENVDHRNVEHVVAASTQLTLEAFGEVHTLYSNATFLAFMIYRDVMVKNEVENIKVIDGCNFGFESYFFESTVKKSSKTRLFVPCFIDKMLDLERYSHINRSPSHS